MDKERLLVMFLSWSSLIKHEWNLARSSESDCNLHSSSRLNEVQFCLQLTLITDLRPFGFFPEFPNQPIKLSEPSTISATSKITTRTNLAILVIDVLRQLALVPWGVLNNKWIWQEGLAASPFKLSVVGGPYGSGLRLTLLNLQKAVQPHESKRWLEIVGRCRSWYKLLIVLPTLLSEIMRKWLDATVIQTAFNYKIILFILNRACGILLSENRSIRILYCYSFQQTNLWLRSIVQVMPKKQTSK